MTKDPFKTFMEQVTNIRDKLEWVRLRVEEVKAKEKPLPEKDMQDDVKAKENSLPKKDMQDDVSSTFSDLSHELHSLSPRKRKLEVTNRKLEVSNRKLEALNRLLEACSRKLELSCLNIKISNYTLTLTRLYDQILTSLIREEGRRARIGGRRVVDAIVVSTVVLLTFVYHYLVGYIDRGSSKAGSAGPLDFRDIYISIVLFQAAYVWIKFRDFIPSIPRGAVYERPRSKWEVRIKFPVTRGVGGKSKRIPLGLYDTKAKGEVVYQIAAFYCKKRKHTGQLDLGGGAYFPIPALSVNPNLPYEEQVNQVRDQVLKVYAEFEEQKASRNLWPSGPGLALEMPRGEGQLLTTSPIQQLQQPLTSGMDSAMQGQGSQLASNIHNGVDLNNPGCILPLLAKTQHELLEAYKLIECLKAQVSQTEDEKNMLAHRNLELECEKGLLEHQNMQLQSQLQPLHSDLDLDPEVFLGLGESLAC